MRRILPADPGKSELRQRVQHPPPTQPGSSQTPPACRTARPARPDPWNLRKPQMLVRHQPRLALLHLLEQFQQRRRWCQPHPQRQRVDEQPHHPLDAGKFRRTARNRHPEHNVVTAGQSPSRIAHATCRISVLSVTPCRRPCSTSPALNPASSDNTSAAPGDPRRTRGIRRRHIRGRSPPTPATPPATPHAPLPGPAAIATRKIIPVRRHTPKRARIAVVRIERQQLLHQNRRRPAVAHQVMAAKHQTMLHRRQPQQRKPQQRRGRCRSNRATRSCSRRVRHSRRSRFPASSPDRSRLRHGAATDGTITCTGRLRRPRAGTPPAGLEWRLHHRPAPRPPAPRHRALPRA